MYIKYHYIRKTTTSYLWPTKSFNIYVWYCGKIFKGTAKVKEEYRFVGKKRTSSLVGCIADDGLLLKAVTTLKLNAYTPASVVY